MKEREGEGERESKDIEQWATKSGGSDVENVGSDRERMEGTMRDM